MRGSPARCKIGATAPMRSMLPESRRNAQCQRPRRSARMGWEKAFASCRLTADAIDHHGEWRRPWSSNTLRVRTCRPVAHMCRRFHRRAGCLPARGGELWRANTWSVGCAPSARDGSEILTQLIAVGGNWCPGLPALLQQAKVHLPLLSSVTGRTSTRHRRSCRRQADGTRSCPASHGCRDGVAGRRPRVRRHHQQFVK